MNKIKKLVLVIILICLSVFIFMTHSCYGETVDEKYQNTSNSLMEPNSYENNSQLLQEQFIHYDLTFVNSHFFRPLNDSKENTYKGNIWWTASLLENGIDLLKTDTIYKVYEDHLKYKAIQEDFLLSNEFNNIKALDYYTDDSSCYDTLTDEDIVLKTINFNPIIGKVKYISSDDRTIESKDYWQKAIYESLEQLVQQRYNTDYLRIDTPVVIRELWEFNDGTHHIEIVAANNVEFDESIAEVRTIDKLITSPIIPDGEMHIIYRVTLVFIDGVLCDLISGSVSLSEEFSIESEREYILEGYGSYQYNDNGTIILSPMYPVEEWYMRDYLHWDSYLFADIDNDTEVEIIALKDYSNSSEVSPNIGIYKLKENSFLRYGSCIEFSNYYFYW